MTHPDSSRGGRPQNFLPPASAAGNWNGEDISARLRVLQGEILCLNRMGFPAEADALEAVRESLRLAHIDRYFTDRRRIPATRKPLSLPSGPF